MIHRNQVHKSEFTKVTQIFKDRLFIHDGVRYNLGISTSKLIDRRNNVHPKDPIHHLFGISDTGEHVNVMSDKCLTVGQHYQIENSKAVHGEAKTDDPRPYPVILAESTPPVSIESDEDPVKPAPKKKAPAKKPTVKGKKK